MALQMHSVVWQVNEAGHGTLTPSLQNLTGVRMSLTMI